MRIEFTRSGGFAGIVFRANIDLKNLSPEEATLLGKQVKDAGFFDLPEQMKSGSPVPDAFEYQIKISSSQGVHAVMVGESMVTEALRPLLDHLAELARSGKYR